MDGNELPEAAHATPSTMTTRRVTRASSRLEAARAAGNEGTHSMFSIPENSRQMNRAMKQMNREGKRRAEGSLDEQEQEESRFQEIKRRYEMNIYLERHMREVSERDVLEWKRKVEENASEMASMRAELHASNEDRDRQRMEMREVEARLRNMRNARMMDEMAQTQRMNQQRAVIRSEQDMSQRLDGLVRHMQDVVGLLPADAIQATQAALAIAQGQAGPATGQAAPAAVVAAAVPVETAEARKARLDAEKEVNDTPESLALAYSRACCVCLCTNPLRRASLVVCGHLVCAVCVELEASGGTTITCPLCRKRTGFIRIYEDLLSETSEARRQADTGDLQAEAAEAPSTSAS